MRIFLNEGILAEVLSQGNFRVGDVAFITYTENFYEFVFGRPDAKKLVLYRAAKAAERIVFHRYIKPHSEMVEFELWLERIGFPGWKWEDHSRLSIFCSIEATTMLRTSEQFNGIEILGFDVKRSA